MSFDAWFTVVVIAGAVVLLATERASAATIVLGAVTALLVGGVIDTEQALSGFSNPAPMTVAALYVLAAAAEKSGAVQYVTARLLASLGSGDPGDAPALLRLLFPTAAASAFLNNTPVVAMVAPAVAAWARRTGRSPSTYLMPISFATILGGTITLIGTSTNLIVAGLMEETGQRPLGFFEITKVGLPVAVVGVALLSAVAPRMLRRRRSASQDFTERIREFTIEMIVTPNSRLAGQSVADAGLRSLQGVFLVEIVRDGQRIAPVEPADALAAGDRLVFAGDVTRIVDLQHVSGLVSAEERHFTVAGSHPQRRFYEAVVGESSPLAGSTLKEIGFRARYGGAVVAVHRAGERIARKLGEVSFRAGDVLLVLADQAFRQRWRDGGDFLVVADVEGASPPRREKAPAVGAIAAGFLVLVVTGLLDVFAAALLAAFALVVSGVLSADEAKRAVDLNVVAVIGGSFGLGTAIAESGLAGVIVQNSIQRFGSIGDTGLLLGIIVTTVVLTELVTNNAAAALMFPIAMATAAAAGLNHRPFAVAIALAASTSFLTPIGYQTNTMVYGMGGYRFGDFSRVGTVITVATITLATVIIPIAWPLEA